MAKTRAVAVAEERALTVTGVEDALFESEAGAGLEHVRGEDQAIPFLRILQDLSPQVKRTNPAYIDGAEAGFILNTVDRTVWDGQIGIQVIPVFFRPTLVEWRPRESGGGYVQTIDATTVEGVRAKAAATKTDDGKLFLPNGNQLVETAQHYVIQTTDDGAFVCRALLAMASTQLRISRQWLTMREQMVGKTADGKRFVLPSYACVYTLQTTSQKNDKGEFWNYKVAFSRRSTAEEVEMARAFYQGIKAGDVKTSDHDDDAASPTVIIHDADLI